jgi:hypothetical protein
MSHADDGKAQIINFLALEYEYKDFEEILLKYSFHFVRKHKSLYLPSCFEWDVTTKNADLTFPDVPNVFIMRTCICKLVYFNKYRNQAIFQINEHSMQNSLSSKFMEFVEKLESKFDVDDEYKLIKKDTKYNNYSLIMDYDPEGFTWFERSGKVKDHLHMSNFEKINVVGVLYLDKRIMKTTTAENASKSAYGFRWKLFQIREIYLRPQKCMIRLTSDCASAASESESNFFVPFASACAHMLAPPPPPPPPPLPPIFKMNTVIKKNEIVNRLKKDSSVQFVISQDELMQVMKKMKSKEIL